MRSYRFAGLHFAILRLHDAVCILKNFCYIFRSTSESRPNSIEGKNVRPPVRPYVRPYVRPSVRTSVRPQKVSLI